MGKITGLERLQEVPAKVMLLYEAVEKMISEDMDMNEVSVAMITERAGIGKGTAYEYFDTKEDILVCAIIFHMQRMVERIEDLLASETHFVNRVDRILDEMETGYERKGKCGGVRYVHIMTDRSNISRMVTEKLQEEPLRNCLPEVICERILLKGIEDGEVRNDLPMEYTVCALISRLMTYMMCIGYPGKMELESKKVRPYLLQSIADELCVQTSVEGLKRR